MTKTWKTNPCHSGVFYSNPMSVIIFNTVIYMHIQLISEHYSHLTYISVRVIKMLAVFFVIC